MPKGKFLLALSALQKELQSLYFRQKTASMEAQKRMYDEEIANMREAIRVLNESEEKE